MKALAIFLIFALNLSLISGTVSSTISYDECMTLFEGFATSDNIYDSPATSLANFTADLCILVLDDVEQGLKPTVCAYSSLFVIYYIEYAYTELASSNSSESIDDYASDYCTNFNDGVLAKLSFINSISTYTATASDFVTKCEAEIEEVTNYWFDPVLPSELITVGDMCEAY